MKNTKKSSLLVFSFALLVVMSLIAALCIQALAASPPPKPKPGGTLTIAMPSLYEQSFLPDQGSASQYEFWHFTFDHLIYVNGITRKFIPGLAKRWQFSKDYSILTVWLRDDVPWQEAKWGKVTAEDVKYTYERLMAKGSMSTNRSVFNAAIERIDVRDPYTLVFYLKRPDPEFLWMLTSSESFAPIVCKKYVETVGDKEAAAKPVSSGPYRLIERKLGELMKFEAVEDHWRVVPEFKYLILRAIPDSSTRIAMLKTGEIDISDIDRQDIAPLRKAGVGAVSRPPGGYWVFYHYGGMLTQEDRRFINGYHRKDPWNDKRVREAMSIAIDRQAIIKAVYQGDAKPVPIVLAFPGWQQLKPIPYDPKRAKQLLAEAGYPNGFSFKILDYSSPPVMELQQLNLILAGYWEKIGLKPELVAMDKARVREILRLAKADAGCIIPSEQGYSDLMIKHADKFLPGGTRVYWQSDESIALFRKLTAEGDRAKRDAIWKEITKYQYDEWTSIPIVIAAGAIGYNKNKVSDWPQNVGVQPSVWEYVRHAKPLNTPRLFTP